MIYLLFFALCCMFIIAYLINQKDILSPWVITIGMFLVSTVFAILNIETWDFQLSSITVIVILSGVFAFGVGELLVSAMFEKHGKVKSIVHTKKGKPHRSTRMDIGCNCDRYDMWTACNGKADI